MKNKISERYLYTPMFIAALFIISKIWKQPKCPLKGEWIKKNVIQIQIYTMGYYSFMRKKEILTTCMDPAGAL